MNNKNICSITNICKYLEDEYSAAEITINEFASQSDCICADMSSNIAKVYKIEDKKVIQNLLSENEKEEILITIEHFERNNLIESENESFCFIYTNQISTGKLIIIILESEDNVNLSGFTMHGNGQKLYNYLISLIGEEIKKNYNPLEETISELNQFRPYGKCF